MTTPRRALAPERRITITAGVRDVWRRLRRLEAAGVYDDLDDGPDSTLREFLNVALQLHRLLKLAPGDVPPWQAQRPTPRYKDAYNAADYARAHELFLLLEQAVAEEDIGNIVTNVTYNHARAD